MNALRALVIAAALVPLVTPDASAQQQLQGFSIVLVQGGQQPGNDSDLPRAAQRAIADMKDFLPFKSYRLVDSAWILASSPSSVLTSRLRGPDNQDYEVVMEAGSPTAEKQPVVFRLRAARLIQSRVESRVEPRGEVLRDRLTLLGAYEDLRRKYETAVQAAKGENTPAVETVDFLRRQLADAESRIADMNRRIVSDGQRSSAGARVDALSAELARQRNLLQTAEADVRALSERLSDVHPDLMAARRHAENLRARVAVLNAQLQEAGRGPFTREPQAATVREPAIPEMPLIDTTFTMRLGETVIVGTSRVGGDKALIAVLTAVPQTKR